MYQNQISLWTIARTVNITISIVRKKQCYSCVIRGSYGKYDFTLAAMPISCLPCDS